MPRLNTGLPLLCTRLHSLTLSELGRARPHGTTPHDCRRRLRLTSWNPANGRADEALEMAWRDPLLRHFGPGLLAGITLGDWVSLLWDNRFAVSPLPGSSA